MPEIDQHEVGSARCARGHWFEDLVSVIASNGGWCPECDGPARGRKDDPAFRPELRTAIIWVEQHDEVRVFRPADPRQWIRYAVIPSAEQERGEMLPTTRPLLALGWHRVEAVEHWPGFVLLFLADGSRIAEAPGTQITLRRPR